MAVIPVARKARPIGRIGQAGGIDGSGPAPPAGRRSAEVALDHPGAGCQCGEQRSAALAVRDRSPRGLAGGWISGPARTPPRGAGRGPAPLAWGHWASASPGRGGQGMAGGKRHAAAKPGPGADHGPARGSSPGVQPGPAPCPALALASGCMKLPPSGPPLRPPPSARCPRLGSDGRGGRNSALDDRRPPRPPARGRPNRPPAPPRYRHRCRAPLLGAPEYVHRPGRCAPPRRY